MLRTLDLIWSWYKYKPWQDNTSAIRQKEEVQAGFMALGRTVCQRSKKSKCYSRQKRTSSPQVERVLHRAVKALHVGCQMYNKYCSQHLPDTLP